MINVIVAGGQAENDFLKEFFAGYERGELYIIACDRGYDICCDVGVTPNLVIGDFDSACAGAYTQVKSRGINVILLNSEKDDSDSEAAVRYILQHNELTGDIYLLGGIGSRIDHLLGNISLVAMGVQNGRRIFLMDSHNRICGLGPGGRLVINRAGQYGKYISVFPYMGRTSGVTLEGFKYPLRDAVLEGFDTLTVSNEIIEEQGVIALVDGYLIIMETMD